MVRILFILACLCLTITVEAQELLILGGLTHEDNLSETTYAWAVEYSHGLSDNVYATLAWQNEGHLQDHHRDGPAVQIWSRSKLINDQFSLAVGLGPYIYFDTAQAAQGAAYANDHGWGLVFSAGLTWHTTQDWLVTVRANRIETDTHIDTTILLIGVGYQLETSSSQGLRSIAPPLMSKTTNHELSVFFGRTILNSFESENSTAYALEYRQGLSSHVDLSVGWLHEGGQHIIRRNGLTAQLWLVQPFSHDQLVLGVGGGAYFVVNKEHLAETGNEDDERISGIITLTGSYRIDANWLARLSWNRIVTGYSRDTDVLLFGGGLRF